MSDKITKSMQLSSMLNSLPASLVNKLELKFGENLAISGVVYDSRQVSPGNLFVALKGGNTDGHRYIQSAIDSGAIAVVGEESISGFAVPYIQVANSRLALAYLSAAYYEFPARKLTIIGVTGTDGKTTTANLIYQILKAADINAGLISTVNAVIGDQVYDTGFHVTTPEAPDIQRFLAQMAAEGLSHVVLEATSHGLAQHRVASCDFDIGIITNITHEHLDFHGSYEEYRRAKASLFDILAGKEEKDSGDLRIAVLNRDDSSFDYLQSYVESAASRESSEISIISYGSHPDANIRAIDTQLSPNGIVFEAVGPGFNIPISCQLYGAYNALNCLAAISACVVGLKINPAAAQRGIYNLRYLPGRMEVLDLGTDFLTIVDFAHTPYALQRALTAAREIIKLKGKSGRVIAVFGSAGLRDVAKRRMMAEISAGLADVTILTAEDPRTESLDEILAVMADGCNSAGGIEGKSFWRVPDRGEAIRVAMRLARTGDAVIALGKGHEQSMCFGEKEYDWDDRTAMRSAAAEYLGLPGPEMPYLPTQGVET